MNQEKPTIGQQLRQARIDAQVGVCELSERGKIARQFIYDVEMSNKPPTEEMIMAYVVTCGLNSKASDALFLDADKTPPDVFLVLKEHPGYCEFIRQKLQAELTFHGG